MIAVTATAALASLALATPASAHVPTAKAECVEDKAVLTVDLRYYAPAEKNTVLVKDGDKVLADLEFGATYNKKFVADGTVAHTFTVTVRAYDDKKYDLDGTYKTPPCVQKPPTTTTPPVTTTTPAVTTTTTPPVTTTAPPPAGPQPQPPLANTGASTTALMLGGLGLLAAGAVTMLLVRRRRA
ncbi:hypothetical protein UK23_30165 [Lentzea aerocolonigenes]|uniref:Gram-positive cocci surface proteins LPxTG domain-containing protein n=1 Tax=Lentzea aerocolonigenes TaxID=68170 RepID=A0A0F0GL20_LENAE|nr:hypothetical protein UK23_30165 [Lentzea aerocolonigenes]